MIELSRTQDEEVGDGTTSVIVLGKFFNLLIYILRKFHYKGNELFFIGCIEFSHLKVVIFDVYGS